MAFDILLLLSLLFNFIFISVYSPDLIKNIGGAILKQFSSNYPDLLPDMQRYCCVVLFLVYVQRYDLNLKQLVAETISIQFLAFLNHLKNLFASPVVFEGTCFQLLNLKYKGLGSMTTTLNIA